MEKTNERGFEDPTPWSGRGSGGLSGAELREIVGISTNVSRIMQDVKDLREDMGDLRGQFVTQDQFEPIKKAVYGLITAILLCIVTYGMNFVLNK